MFFQDLPMRAVKTVGLGKPPLYLLSHSICVGAWKMPLVSFLFSFFFCSSFGYITQFVGSQFPNQGLNSGCGSESPKL